MHWFRIRNDLYCDKWGVKLYSLTPCTDDKMPEQPAMKAKLKESLRSFTHLTFMLCGLYCGQSTDEAHMV